MLPPIKFVDFPALPSILTPVNDCVALARPNEILVVPTLKLLFANIVFETVPLSPEVTTVPVVAGNVIVFVPAIAVGCTVIVPLVAPGNATELIPVNAKFALDRLIATDVVPIY